MPRCAQDAPTKMSHGPQMSVVVARRSPLSLSRGDRVRLPPCLPAHPSPCRRVRGHTLPPPGGTPAPTPRPPPPPSPLPLPPPSSLRAPSPSPLPPPPPGHLPGEPHLRPPTSSRGPPSPPPHVFLGTPVSAPPPPPGDPPPVSAPPRLPGSPSLHARPRTAHQAPRTGAPEAAHKDPHRPRGAAGSGARRGEDAQPQ